MNANIMKTHFFLKIIYHLDCHFYVMVKFSDFFTLRSNLNTNLTYALMDNFCPCLLYVFEVKEIQLVLI